jgi:serine O-acetyltransferase
MLVKVKAIGASKPMKYDRDAVKAWAGDSQWRACLADFARFRQHGYTGWGTEGFWAIALFRLQKSVLSAQPGWLWAPARLGLGVVRKLLTMLTLIDIHPNAEIGPGLLIAHGGPIRVHRGSKIGADCAIHHVCTVGASLTGDDAPTIGDHVLIGCHASVLGSIAIGDGATVASNSLVITNVPMGCTAIGVPAKVLPAMPRATNYSISR